MLPNGFKPVVPAAGRQADLTPVRLGVDKRQIMSISFSLPMAEEMGLIDTSDPIAVKAKLTVGVNETQIFLAPVGVEHAGWEAEITKGQTPRVQVQIPLPAMFNVVAEPFRQTSITGLYDFEGEGILIQAESLLFKTETKAQAETQAQAQAQEQAQAQAETQDANQEGQDQQHDGSHGEQDAQQDYDPHGEHEEGPQVF